MVKYKYTKNYISPSAKGVSTMIEKIRSESMDLLFEAILTLESVEDCYKFFDDLCTSIELKSSKYCCWSCFPPRRRSPVSAPGTALWWPRCRPMPPGCSPGTGTRGSSGRISGPPPDPGSGWRRCGRFPRG